MLSLNLFFNFFYCNKKCMTNMKLMTCQFQRHRPIRKIHFVDFIPLLISYKVFRLPRVYHKYFNTKCRVSCIPARSMGVKIKGVKI